MCVQPRLLTVTKDTPRSINRRANKQHWPIDLPPYCWRTPCRFVRQVERTFRFGRRDQSERTIKIGSVMVACD